MSIFVEIAERQAEGGAVALCVIVRAQGSTPRRAGSKMLVYPDGRLSGTIGGGRMEHEVVQEALAVLQDGQPRRLTYSLTDPERGDPGVCGGQLEVYVEPILPEPTVVVYGMGHVGREVAALAAWLGLRVIAADDRGTVSDATDAPEIPVRQIAPEELGRQIAIHAHTYWVLTTRNVDVDVAALPVLLESEAAYIGVIGSRRRWETTRTQLKAAGVAEERLARVISPVGLEIQAESPKEIAVSILAEIIQQMHRGWA